MIPLGSLVPNVEDFLALEVEEVAGVLLVHLNTGATHNGEVNRFDFFRRRSDYACRQDEVDRALMEAWAWLLGEGFIVKKAPSLGDVFFLSRRARELTTRENFESYQRGNLLPKGQLHPSIAKVYPAFLRGEYDTAVFQAFREVEIAVRTAAGLGSSDFGTALMEKAFKFAPPGSAGPLTDTNLPAAEQRAMRDLFHGAIAFYKNPTSHRFVPTDAASAAEVIQFASQLLRLVDRASGGNVG